MHNNVQLISSHAQIFITSSYNVLFIILKTCFQVHPNKSLTIHFSRNMHHITSTYLFHRLNQSRLGSNFYKKKNYILLFIPTTSIAKAEISKCHLLEKHDTFCYKHSSIRRDGKVLMHTNRQFTLRP